MSSRLRRPLGVVAVVAVAALASCSDDDASGAGVAGSAATTTAATTAASVAGTVGSTNPESTADEGGGAEQFTPVIMEVLATPRWFIDSTGAVRVPYELRLTNAFPFPATVTEVAVREVASGEEVQTLSGDDLLATMSLQPSGAQPTVELDVGEVGVLWMDIPFEDPAELPAEIEHTVTITLPDDLPLVLPDPIASTAGRVEIDPHQPIVIGPPLEGAGWVAFGSCCDGPHRRALQPVDNELRLAQRYAIDFNKVDEQGRFATGDPGLNESWVTYDQPVLAVADATVVHAADGFADQVSGADTPVSLSEADGNYIILEVAEGTYAFYAHLKPGSVRVKPGDTVRMGQVMARAGNSGSSGGPHLHFQLMDRPSALLANGIPYGFSSFTVTGQIPPIGEVMAGDPREPVTIDTSTAGPRTNQLPVGRDVVEFASAP